jgi:ABC-2 type transport system permease protein
VPIHAQGYRRYHGTRATRGRAWIVIARTGIRARLRQRRFLGLLLISWVPFLVRTIQLYAAVTLPQAAFLAPTPELFRQFLGQQQIFVFFTTVYGGAGLIANDRLANALQIYLSKPLTRVEYVIGKLAILMTFLLLITWLPATALLLVQIIFAGNLAFFTNNVYLLPAIAIFSIIDAVVVATVMLAFSSLSKSSRYVGILFTVLLFFSEAISGVLRFVAGDTRLAWISVPVDLSQVGDVIFQLSPRYDTPWPLSLLVILVLIACSGFVLARRVQGVEVIT